MIAGKAAPANRRRPTRGEWLLFTSFSSTGSTGSSTVQLKVVGAGASGGSHGI